MTYLSIKSDAKTTKGVKFGYLTGINYLAPAWSGNTGVNLCPYASKDCLSACLNTSGLAGVYKSIIKARIAKTKSYVANPRAFVDGMRHAIKALVSRAQREGLTAAIRINGTSDVPKLAQRLAREFPDTQFYDYTKVPQPWLRTLPNYHLTFSFSGENLQDCMDALAHGVNVAVVFHGQLPETWHDYKVIDGDQSDLRFLDPTGVIVGLTAKGRAKTAPTGGFVQIGEINEA